MTKTLAVIGYPLKHTLSPVIQQAALDHLGIDARFEAWETEPGDLVNVLTRIRGAGYLGLCATIPFKELVIPLLDEIDPLASRIGAVNTIANRGGRLVGYNTDAPGFIRPLRERTDFQLEGARTVVVGAGGAARAVAFALSEAGANPLYILNRGVERAEALAADLRRSSERPDSIRPLPLSLSESIQSIVQESDLIVNTTSMGMKHGAAEKESAFPAAIIPSRALVYDIVYNPRVTPLLAEAKRAGARTVEGLAMLVYQGAFGFEIWTGQKAPVDVMMAAVETAFR